MLFLLQVSSVLDIFSQLAQFTSFFIGHWEVSTFSGFRDETKDKDRSFGTFALIEFFGKAMQVWAKQVNEMLTADRNGPGAAMNRRIVVRSYLPGHDGENYLPTLFVRS